MTINKLSEITYTRLVAQASEARELHMNDLAEQVLGAVGSTPRDAQEEFKYSAAELTDALRQGLWKMAMEIVAYHDAKGVDIQTLHAAIEQDLLPAIESSIETACGVQGKIGPYEEKLPGQK